MVFEANTMGLSDLGGDVSKEHWCGPADRFGICSVVEHDPVDQDPAAVVEKAYLALFADAKSKGFADALRIWQFIPGINQGQADQERYRRFCVGRARALDALGIAEDKMCGATAIGCLDETFRLFALFGKAPGLGIENPRQVSAWDYPRDYGPVAPAFARATVVALDGVDFSKGSGILVSGTAAVVGHESAHPGDVSAQTEEAITNVELVVEQAQKTHGTAPRAVGDQTFVRAYLRNAADWSRVSALLKARWPDASIMGVAGDICRKELLVELEAWHPSQTNQKNQTNKANR